MQNDGRQTKPESGTTIEYNLKEYIFKKYKLSNKKYGQKIYDLAEIMSYEDVYEDDIFDKIEYLLSLDKNYLKFVYKTLNNQEEVMCTFYNWKEKVKHKALG